MFFPAKKGDLQKRKKKKKKKKKKKEKKKKRKKRSSSQKCHEIRCQSTKITKIPVANTSLGLDMHSCSPEPVNFFGAQSSLGGAQAVIWGSTAQECPLVAPGLTSSEITFDYTAFIRKQNSLRYCSVRYRYSFVNETL